MAAANPALIDDIDRLGKKKEELDLQVAKLQAEIESAGGERLRSLPGLIAHEEQLARIKSEHRARFERSFTRLGSTFRDLGRNSFTKFEGS